LLRVPKNNRKLKVRKCHPQNQRLKNPQLCGQTRKADLWTEENRGLHPNLREVEFW
ncbi:hypothetical protein STEG23_036302, partial [Scotinomys teguina]